MVHADAIRARLSSTITPLLVSGAIGIYALVIVGATVSVNEGAAACSTWPSCNGQWIVPLGDTTLVVVMAHRLLALVVGALLLLGLAGVWFLGAPRRIRAALIAVTALYPVQVALGAITAVSGGASPFPLIHLGIALTIFAGVLLSLVWWLERQTTDVQSTFDTGSSLAAEPADPPASTGRVRAYFQLMKPRLMWLLCFVALAGIGLATATTGLPISPELVFGTLLGGVLAIGASGTFNHVLERDVDRKMGRTSDRPTVTDRVSIRNATIFGVLLSIAAIMVFLTFVNVLAAVLGLIAILFYSVVYTLMLKPHTSQNIVIGGAVGALPALIGWAAVTESIGLPALVLGLLIFLWTPAHFYNLALAYKQDYERGGFPMLPIARGEAVTLRHIAWYFGATLVAAVFLGIVAPLGLLYALTVVVFASIFLLAIVHLYRVRTPAIALRSFHASNAFLGIVMLVIILDTLVF